MDDYSDEQKAKISRHFVLYAPHGEIHSLVKDLKEVVPTNILTDRWLHDSMTEYNKRRFEIVEGDANKVLCCPQAEVQPNKYLNPDKNIVCEVDPVKQKIVAVNEAEASMSSGQFSQYRDAIQTALKNYLSSYYEDGTTPNSYAKGVGTVYVSGQGKVAIVISFKNLNQSNYWTGGWQSEWTLSVAQHGSTRVEGRIRLNVHYFEDGNVQLNCTLNENAEVNVAANPAETAEGVIDAIQGLESNFQQRLDQFYVQMNKSTFKNMRRFLPKTQTKMDWRSTVHALVAEAAGSSGK